MTTDPDRREVATDATKSNDMRTADVVNGENPDDSTSQAPSDHADQARHPVMQTELRGRFHHEGGRPQETRDLEGDLPA